MFSCGGPKHHPVDMNTRTLVVLVDGEPGDSTLVRAAREYANGCSITLLRVLPEVRRAARTDRGALILPWQAMQLMKAGAKFDLELLKERYLDDRALPTKTMVRFGDVIDEVAAACYAAHPQAILVRSRARSLVPAWNRDQRLLRRLATPVLFIGAADEVVGEQSAKGAGPLPLSFPDKVKAIYHLPVFAGMSRKELEMIARNLDETSVDAGTVVIREGKSNLAFWIVLDGEFELTLRGKVLERITAPGVVGAPSMLDGMPAWASATAVTPVKALVASKEQFPCLALV